MNQLQAGWARVALAPQTPYPMAGIVIKGERLATWVRDPTRVTAVALREDGRTFALLGMDLLMVDSLLHAEVEDVARSLGYDGVFLNASHTHSAMGGTIDRRLARLFMGRFRSQLRALLLDRLRTVLAAALKDLTPVTGLHAGTAAAPGLTMNRRRIGGPTDDRVLALKLCRADAAPILIWSTSGHPVLVAMSDDSAESADYPGRVCADLEEGGNLPLFVLGAAGGLNPIFPEFPIALDDHMDLVTGLIEDGIERALTGTEAILAPALTWRRRDVHLRRAGPPGSSGTPGSAMRAGISGMVGRVFASTVADRETDAPVIMLGIGPVRLVGMPADFGVGATLHIRDAMTGGELAVVASHSNGFVGYVHLPDDYRWSPEVHSEMFHYENAMGWYGRDAGRHLADAAIALADDAASALEDGKDSADV